MGKALKIAAWVLLIAIGCGFLEIKADPGTDRSMRWFDQTPKGRVRGVALVVHGLNLNPDRMINLIRSLNAIGITSLLVSLRGHGDNFEPIAGMDPAEARLEAFKSVSYRIWSDDFLKAYQDSRSIGEKLSVPHFLIANSYGALLALEQCLSVREVEFDRMVLFAPALSLHGRNSLIRLFAFWPKLVIPSLSPEFYLANRGTPVAAYSVVFETLARFEKAMGPKINIPALVFIDARDELVSYNGLRELIQKNQLDRWRLFRVEKEAATAATRVHHLMIDPASVGQSTWEPMVKAMQSHLLRFHSIIK